MSDTLRAVYDVRDGSYVGGEWAEPFDEWVREQGLPLREIYRMEIHLLDCPFARVFEYDKDDNGELFCLVDHAHLDDRVYGPGEEPREEALCEAAERTPYDVPISSMPPVPPATTPTPPQETP